MADLSIDGVADIEYSLVDGRVRSFELRGEVLFDEGRGIVMSGWRDALWVLVKEYGLDVDDGIGLNAFVYPLIAEYGATEVH